MRCRADRLILRPRCPGQRDAGVGTTPGAEGDGGAKAGVALSGPRRPGPQSSRSVQFRVEIGPVPRRDRFDGGAPGGPGPRGGHFGASPTAASSDSHRNVDLDGNEAVRRRESFPHERRIAPRRAQPAPRGRTRRRTVVPRSTRSYPGSRGRTLKPPYSTTRRRSVRPRAFMYDRATRVRPARGNGRRPRRTYDHTSNGTTARPSHRTRPHPTHHPHTPTTATHPDRKPHSTSVRRPPPASSRTASPHNHDKRTELDGEDRESTAARRPPCGGRRAAVTRTRAATA